MYECKPLTMLKLDSSTAGEGARILMLVRCVAAGRLSLQLCSISPNLLRSNTTIWHCRWPSERWRVGGVEIEPKLTCFPSKLPMQFTNCTFQNFNAMAYPWPVVGRGWDWCLKICPQRSADLQHNAWQGAVTCYSLLTLTWGSQPVYRQHSSQIRAASTCLARNCRANQVAFQRRVNVIICYVSVTLQQKQQSLPSTNQEWPGQDGSTKTNDFRKHTKHKLSID